MSDSIRRVGLISSCRIQFKILRQKRWFQFSHCELSIYI